MSLLFKVYEHLAAKGTVPATYKPHKLSGSYNDCFECHIKPDWLLIWKIDHRSDEVLLVRTGTHSDLF